MNKIKIRYSLMVFLFLFFFLLLLFFSSTSSKAVKDAITLCGTSVIPSLFPFFVVSKLIINLRILEPVSLFLKRIMPPLFSVSGNAAPALLLGITSGYPIGAATCCELYESGDISRRQAERLLSFCNNSGPAFIISAIGISVFGSLRIGIALFFLHILSALLVGFIMRLISPVKVNKNTVLKRKAQPSFSFAFTDAVSSALASSLKISAYIVFFAVVVSLIKEVDIFSLIGLKGTNKAIAEASLCGMLEITAGIYKISELLTFKKAFVISAFFLGWGGISVHCQALSYIANSDINPKEYFLGKLLHGITSGFLAFLLIHTRVFRDIGVSALLNVHYSKNLNLIMLFSLILVAFLIFLKKGWKKT